MKLRMVIAGLPVLGAGGLFDLPGLAVNQAAAQMDWLSLHFDNQRWNRLGIISNETGRWLRPPP
jgi:hypothetical protein